MSEGVNSNSHGLNIPAFSVGGALLTNKDSFKYLGMVFNRTHNIAKSAEHTLGPFMAECHGIRQFAREHHLMDRPNALLWLAKCYAITTSMYACQVWGTRSMKKGREFDSTLKTAHMCFLRGVLGVKRTTLSPDCVARLWTGAFAVVLVPRCCLVFIFSTCGNNGLLKKKKKKRLRQQGNPCLRELRKKVMHAERKKDYAKKVSPVCVN